MLFCSWYSLSPDKLRVSISEHAKTISHYDPKCQNAVLPTSTSLPNPSNPRGNETKLGGAGFFPLWGKTEATVVPEVPAPSLRSTCWKSSWSWCVCDDHPVHMDRTCMLERKIHTKLWFCIREFLLVNMIITTFVEPCNFHPWNSPKTYFILHMGRLMFRNVRL